MYCYMRFHHCRLYCINNVANSYVVSYFYICNKNNSRYYIYNIENIYAGNQPEGLWADEHFMDRKDIF